MRLLRKPSQASIDQFIENQSTLTFSYPSVGGTKSQVPKRFNVDRNRILLGYGDDAYQSACQALRQWKMFPSDWTEIQPANAELQAGVVVAMLARCFGRWWLNSCRIVYAFDETIPVRRFGFAYGTLPGHVESGEERFMIEWDENDRVWYEIYSFSRPRYWLVRLAYPLARMLQKRFVRHSMAQMQRIVAISEAARISALSSSSEINDDSYNGVPTA